MTPTEDDRFTRFLRDKSQEAKKQVGSGFGPNTFLGMLGSQGGYRTVVQLLSDKKVSNGFTNLLLAGRLDLSVEALVLESEWRRNFDTLLLKKAEARLNEANYQIRAIAIEVDGPEEHRQEQEGAVAQAGERPLTSTASLILRWPKCIEYLTLELDRLQPGFEFESVETLVDGSHPTTYSVRCVEVVRSPERHWSIVLAYDPSHGKNTAVAAKYGDSVEWGTLNISISSDLAVVTGAFEEVGAGEAVIPQITFVPTGLFSGMSRAQIEVLLRPDQGRLRKRLLESYGECVVSRECTEQALEAAHIVDHAVSGSSSEGNAILLRADLHTLFDRGMLRISVDGKIDLVRLPTNSRYHAERKNWNKVLPDKVLTAVRDALKARAAIRD
jgi:hypothetical protein